MASSFVAINDPVQRLLRDLTRQTPLGGGVSSSGGLGLRYAIRPGDLPEAYFALARFHALEGLPIGLTEAGIASVEKSDVVERTGGFDAVRLDRRCARDLRLKPGAGAAGLSARELLVFGAGTLRACNDDRHDAFHRFLWRQYGRLQPRREAVFARIRALHADPLTPGELRKECYHSTNLIYGDAFGEIEQLWERRADTAFLEEVVENLKGPFRIGAFLRPPVSLDSLIEFHLCAQARWRTPPATARALLRRLDYILAHTCIDNSPPTVFNPAEPAPAVKRHRRSSTHWRADRSGYDGWLGASD